MKFVVILSCLVLYSFSYCEALKFVLDEGEDGHYWRDYTGKLPKDALPGVKNPNGKTLYIGQTLHQNLIVPGYIDPIEQSVVFEYKNLAIRAIENMKILCTRNPNNFKWIKTSNDEIRKIEGVELVSGGYEDNTDTFIGRAERDGLHSIGKLLVTDFGFTGLHLVSNGKIEHFSNYEVLANTKSTSETSSDRGHKIQTVTTDKIGEGKCPQSRISINVF